MASTPHNSGLSSFILYLIIKITTFYIWAVQYEIDYGKGMEQDAEIVAFYKWAVQCEINYRKGIEQDTETCDQDRMLRGTKPLNSAKV